MGGILGRKKYKRNYEHGNGREHGYAERQNRPISHQMEDQASYLQFTSTVNGVAQEAQFWGIFDGHNGWNCSLHCAKHFANELAIALEHVENFEKIEETVATTMQNFDRQIKQKKIKGGCVLVMCLKIENNIWIIHSGDCRGAVVSQHEIHLESNSIDPWGAMVNFRDDWTKWKIVDIQEGSQIGRAGLDQSTSYYVHGIDDLILTEKTQDAVKNKLASGESCDLILRTIVHVTNDHTPISCREEIVKKVRRNMEFGLLQKAGWTEQNCIQGEGKFAKILGTIGCARGFGDFDLFTPTKIRIPLKPFLSCDPEIKHFNLDEIPHDCFCLLGCDGIFDEVETYEACSMTNEKNKEKSLDTIIDLSRERGSKDDCTLFMIPLQKAHN